MQTLSSLLRVTPVREVVGQSEERGRGTKVGGSEVERSRSRDRGSGGDCAERRAGADCPRPGRPSTHNAVWGRCAPDETLHLAAVAPHGILHCLAGDNGGPCEQKTQSGSAGARSACPPGPVPRGPLTIHVKRHLPLSHSDAGHDGPAGVGAGVGLGHRLQQQLVAVAQDLGRESSLGWGARRPGPLGPGGPHWMYRRESRKGHK